MQVTTISYLDNYNTFSATMLAPSPNSFSSYNIVQILYRVIPLPYLRVLMDSHGTKQNKKKHKFLSMAYKTFISWPLPTSETSSSAFCPFFNMLQLPGSCQTLSPLRTHTSSSSWYSSFPSFSLTGDYLSSSDSKWCLLFQV